MDTKKNSPKLIIIVIIGLILCIAASLITVFLANSGTDTKMSVTLTGSGIMGTSSDDIIGIITDADTDGEHPYIEIEWINRTSTEFAAGEKFYIYRNDNYQLTDCRKNPAEYTWNYIAYILPAEGRMKMSYYIGDMNFEKNGTYHLETEIFPSDEYSEKVTLWLEFRTGEVTDETAAA